MLVRLPWGVWVDPVTVDRLGVAPDWFERGRNTANVLIEFKGDRAHLVHDAGSEAAAQALCDEVAELLNQKLPDPPVKWLQSAQVSE